MDNYNKDLVKQSIIKTKFYYDGIDYIMVKIKKNDIPNLNERLSKIDQFFSLISDPNESSVIMPIKFWKKHFEEKIEQLDQMFPLAKIYCDVSNLGLCATGYIKEIANILSPNDIGLIILAGYTYDHILIKKEKIHKALNLLTSFQKRIGHSK